jgi:hypothetical protein
MVTAIFIAMAGLYTLSHIVGYLFNLSPLGILYLYFSVLLLFLFLYFIFIRIDCKFKYHLLDRKELYFVGFFIALSVVLTLCLNRPDADDQYYLNSAIEYLAKNTHPISESKYVHQRRAALAAYESLRASVSAVFNIPMLTSYYLLVPAIFSIFVVTIHIKLLRLTIRDDWVYGMFFFFIVMLVWGDIHRTHANFGLVRLFQGKAVFVSLIIPAIIYYFFKFIQSGNSKYTLCFLASIFAGFGFTPTALVVEPLLLIVLYISGIFSFKKSDKSYYITLFSAVFMLILLGLLFKQYFNISNATVHTPRGTVEHTTNLEMITYVIGSGFRGWFALFCFIISPFFIRNTSIRKVYFNFTIICCLLMAIPWTSEFIAKNTYMTASWRWLWMIPFPFAISVVMGSIPRILPGRMFNIPIGFYVYFIICLIFILSSKRNVLSEENYTTFSLPKPKIESNKMWLRNYGEYGLIEGNRICVESLNQCY